MAGSSQDSFILLTPEETQTERNKLSLENSKNQNLRQDFYWPYKLHIIEIIIWLILILEIVWPALFLLAHLDLGHAAPLNILKNQMAPTITQNILNWKRDKSQGESLSPPLSLYGDGDDYNYFKGPKAVQEALRWIEMTSLNGTKLLTSKNRPSTMTMNDLSKYLQTTETPQLIPLNLTILYRILLYADHLNNLDPLSITLMVRIPILILILVAVFQIPLLLTVEHIRHQRGTYFLARNTFIVCLFFFKKVNNPL